MTTDRIEQAAPDVRDVLEDAWRDHHGYPLECHPIEAKCPYCNKFRRFLDAEAYTDAALMLVPEGWTYLSMEVCARGLDTQHCRISLERMEGEIETRSTGYGQCLPLAIASASLRAKGPGHE